MWRDNMRRARIDFFISDFSAFCLRFQPVGECYKKPRKIISNKLEQICSSHEHKLKGKWERLPSPLLKKWISWYLIVFQLKFKSLTYKIFKTYYWPTPFPWILHLVNDYLHFNVLFTRSTILIEWKYNIVIL